MIVRHARVILPRLRPEAKADALQEIAANAAVAYARLAELGKEDLAYATPLATYAVAQYRAGRRVGNRLNVRDVLSPYCQQRKHVTVESLDRFDEEENQWQEAVVEDTRTATVPDIVPKDYHFEWAKSVNLRKGADVTLIGTGFMTYYCMEAAGLLAQEGIQARVDHHPCLKPIDKDGIIAAAKQTGCVVTAENHGINGGLGSAVAEVLVEGHPVPMERIGIRDMFVECGEVPDLFVKYRVRPEDIAEAARNVIARRKAGASR